MDKEEKSLVLRKLIDVSNEISEISEFKCVIRKQCSDLSRRLRLLTPLFEELGETEERVSEEAGRALANLKDALEKAKNLLQFGSRGSKIYMARHFFFFLFSLPLALAVSTIYFSNYLLGW